MPAINTNSEWSEVCAAHIKRVLYNSLCERIEALLAMRAIRGGRPFAESKGPPIVLIAQYKSFV